MPVVRFRPWAPTSVGELLVSRDLRFTACRTRRGRQELPVERQGKILRVLQTRLIPAAVMHEVGLAELDREFANILTTDELALL